MFGYSQYVRAKSLEEAYELNRKKTSVILGGTLWLKMQNRTCGTAIDLCDLGLNQIEESEEAFTIGAYVSLRELEKHPALHAYTDGAMEEAMKHIVGVQFRNCATVGGSLYGRYGFSDVYTIFEALGAQVELFHAGVMSLSEFAKRDRAERDILVRVIVPKTGAKVAYLSQRNSQTDFPVLTVAVSKKDEQVTAVVGARPHLAQAVSYTWGNFSPTEQIEAQTSEHKAQTSEHKAQASEEKALASEALAAALGKQVADAVTFGTNPRASAAYRKHICGVLVKRAMLQILQTEEEEVQ